jgi:hypothetical protein
VLCIREDVLSVELRTAPVTSQQVVSAGVTDVIEETLQQHGKQISSAHWLKQYPVYT